MTAERTGGCILAEASNRAAGPARREGGVNIADVRTIRTAPEGIHPVAVRAGTYETGLYGVGCATFAQCPPAVR